MVAVSVSRNPMPLGDVGEPQRRCSIAWRTIEYSALDLQPGIDVRCWYWRHRPVLMRVKPHHKPPKKPALDSVRPPQAKPIITPRQAQRHPTAGSKTCPHTRRRGLARSTSKSRLEARPWPSSHRKSRTICSTRSNSRQFAIRLLERVCARHACSVHRVSRVECAVFRHFLRDTPRVSP